MVKSLIHGEKKHFLHVQKRMFAHRYYSLLLLSCLLLFHAAAHPYMVMLYLFSVVVIVTTEPEITSSVP